jgi:hypothetical protein
MPLIRCHRTSNDGDVTLAEVWPVGGKPAPHRRASIGPGLKQKEEKKAISFRTGPTGQPTHWKQTLFLLKDPILASEGKCPCFMVYNVWYLLRTLHLLRYCHLGYFLDDIYMIFHRRDWMGGLTRSLSSDLRHTQRYFCTRYRASRSK